MGNVRELDVLRVKEAVAKLCVEANRYLPEDLEGLLQGALEQEESLAGRDALKTICENCRVAAGEGLAICQDTGMAVVFLEVGQDLHFVGGDLNDAVNAGISEGYSRGYLRASVVADPLERVNTGDNTPGILHLKLVPGDRLRIRVAPKGFGSENMSRLKMFTPSAGEGELLDFLAETVTLAGSNPCPPIVVGVGLGGDFESVALLAKEALCRSVSQRNPQKIYRELEGRMLERVNALGIGPQGFGGRITALAVNIEAAPTHIAGLPMAINIGCHVTRHRGLVL